ncbi:MAG: HAD-IIIA family hydrolase [Candidatus Bilamarchaeaceae archaeon]
MVEKPIVAILVGGLGTRLRPLTLKIPKPLIKINKKPFLYYLLSQLSLLGLKEVVLLLGYKGKMVKRFCGEGKKFGLRITYSEEKEPLGTGGALLNAFSEAVTKPILLFNGDTYLNFDLDSFISFHNQKKAWASIYAMEGELKDRGSIVIEKNGLVKEFLEKQKSGFGLFNAGVYLFNSAAIRYLHSLLKKGRLPRIFSIEKDVFPLFAAKKKLFAYHGKGFFLDIGTFQSLKQAEEFFKNREKGKPAIFLDRDGVINKHRFDYVKFPHEFVFEKNSIPALKKLSKLKLPIFIVTNQSMIGRGIATKNMLSRIHKKMLEVFKINNIKVNGIFVCPHRPEDNCECRKPKPGMLLKIQKKFRIDLSSSYVVGDSSADILMGNIVGSTTILVKKGLKGKDKNYVATPSFVVNDLLEAAKLIKKLYKKSRK